MFTSAGRMQGANKSLLPPTSDAFLANVSYLSHYDGPNAGTFFSDYKGHAATAVGTPTTSTTQFKYGSASLSLNGSSAITYGAAADLAMGAGDFTIECWVYQTSRSAVSSVLCCSASSGSSGIIMQIGSTGTLQGSTASAGLGGAGTVPLNTWTHVAFSRNSGSITMWLGGTKVFTVADSTNYTDNIFHIGQFSGASQRFTGFIDDVRLTKGVGRYTAAFTPNGPFWPSPSDTFFGSVKGLMHMEGTNGGTVFTDQIGHTITTTGTVTTSTAVAPYGTSSALFTGAGHLGFPISTDFAFAGDFTIEFTMVLNSVTGNQTIMGNYTSNTTGHWMFRMQGTVPVWYYNSAGAFTMNSGALSIGVTYRVALVRSGTNVVGYIDGVAIGTAGTLSGQFGLGTNVLAIGSRSDSTENSSCYIDELRITNGVARYTANYTYSTTTFPDF